MGDARLLGVALAHVPPFLLTGLALVIGSIPACRWRHWRVPASTLLLGVGGLFGFHFLLFLALRHAPPMEANLVNYLWPLLIVVLAPVLLPGVRLRPVHVVAALAGFAGAALAILCGRDVSGTLAWGYLPALGSAFIWAAYSLLTRRVPHFPTAAIGLFGLVSGCWRSPAMPGSSRRQRSRDATGCCSPSRAWVRSARRSSCGMRRSSAAIRSGSASSAT